MWGLLLIAHMCVVPSSSCFCQVVSHATLCPQQALTARQVAVSTRCLSGSQRLVAGARSHVGCGDMSCRDLDDHQGTTLTTICLFHAFLQGTSPVQVWTADAGRAAGWQHPVTPQPCYAGACPSIVLAVLLCLLGPCRYECCIFRLSRTSCITWAWDGGARF